jgi:hypothetical protein
LRGGAGLLAPKNNSVWASRLLPSSHFGTPLRLPPVGTQAQPLLSSRQTAAFENITTSNSSAPCAASNCNDAAAVLLLLLLLLLRSTRPQRSPAIHSHLHRPPPSGLTCSRPCGPPELVTPPSAAPQNLLRTAPYHDNPRSPTPLLHDNPLCRRFLCSPSAWSASHLTL